MIWLVVVVGLLIAAFGATAGAALITVSRAELTRAVGRRLRGAAPSLAWLAEVDADLTAASATTSLGVLIVGAALPGLLAGSGRSLVVLLALAGVPLVLLAAYLVPRWLTLPRAQSVADRVMPLLRPWSRVLGLVLPARAAKRPTDLRSIWREGAAVGLPADDELVMVGGVMAFSVRPVREVMTPRTELVAVEEHAALEDIRQVFGQSGYSRIPVYRGTLDEIVGMLHAFDLFKLRPGDPLPVRPVAVTPGSRACGDLLLDMQRERRHLAVVLDEFGGTLGIATLEDLLEELVGEIFDEHDEEVHTEPDGGPTIFETDGNLPPEAIEERFGVALPEGQSTTVAGRIVEWAGRIPNPGERFLVRGLELDIIEASPTRIERIIIRAADAPAIALHAGSPGS
ncbi:MAG TPA: hemolysin family protein [Gemmatimonadales bacterium]|jgi:CBS domain containing-hemolysin-like protein